MFITYFRERQQQLEELTKELGRIQDEADGLRIKLKAYKNNKVSTVNFLHTTLECL